MRKCRGSVEYKYDLCNYKTIEKKFKINKVKSNSKILFKIIKLQNKNYRILFLNSQNIIIQQFAYIN